jgi:hypothetical protein
MLPRESRNEHSGKRFKSTKNVVSANQERRGKEACQRKGARHGRYVKLRFEMARSCAIVSSLERRNSTAWGAKEINQPQITPISLMTFGDYSALYVTTLPPQKTMAETETLPPPIHLI